MLRPKLVAALKHWQDDWKSTEQKRAAKSLAEQLADEKALRRAAEAELHEVKAELATCREELDQVKARETAREQSMALSLEEEREKRVAHLQQIGVRRLFSQGLARGWTAWVHEYNEYKRKKNLLQNAGARMARPKLVHAFAK